ncbi:hypothetical protein CDAR_387781 [Caerostris darwini]|uniref:Uncharacterized protein n=1 Tax=Caerostris darwini TaxID=1538125 RepID=A0AAV4SUU9_9ARAC|nr:hypothetical protein CDAR_387781 [Caerostris darwini]
MQWLLELGKRQMTCNSEVLFAGDREPDCVEVNDKQAGGNVVLLTQMKFWLQSGKEENPLMQSRFHSVPSSGSPGYFKQEQ